MTSVAGRVEGVIDGANRFFVVTGLVPDPRPQVTVYISGMRLFPHDFLWAARDHLALCLAVAPEPYDVLLVEAFFRCPAGSGFFPVFACDP